MIDFSIATACDTQEIPSGSHPIEMLALICSAFLR
jgi:hypothetical protein